MGEFIHMPRGYSFLREPPRQSAAIYAIKYHEIGVI